MRGLRRAEGQRGGLGGKLGIFSVPEDVLEAMDVIRRAGGEVYIVGGAVRDLLLGVEPQDYDIATNLRPEEVLEVFAREGWVTVPKGIQYGVASVVHPVTGREIEVATFRREYYPLDYQRRAVEVEYAGNIEEDLARRDFTINAMALSPEGELVDPFGGRFDLERGMVRFVGEPYERIREDPLRMLRAVRFASKYGFQLEPATEKAIREHAGLLRYISRERVGEEVKKAMKGVKPELFPVMLYETGLHWWVLPHLEPMARTRHGVGGHHHGETVLEHTVEVMERMRGVSPEWEFRLASMLHDVGKPWTRWEEGGRVTFHKHEAVGSRIARGLVKHYWRLPGRTARFVGDIVAYHMAPLQMASSLSGRALASRLRARYGGLAEPLALHAYADTGEEYWLDVARLIREEMKRPKPLLTGHDIMKIYGVPPGPEVGRLKQLLYEIQLRKNITSKEKLIKEACKEGVCPK